MFGQAPKTLWEQWHPADAQNRIHLACRCLLIQSASQNILFEVGIGPFFQPTLADRYGIDPNGEHLMHSLAQTGISPADIDLVICSHLHFDHIGGLMPSDRRPTKPRFPKATLHFSERQQQVMAQPHRREKASFPPLLQELLSPYPVRTIDDRTQLSFPGGRITFFPSEGHTEGHLSSMIHFEESGSRPLFFCGDLIPGAAWCHPALAMGYDRCAHQVLEEKQHWLSLAQKANAFLFFFHDPKIAMLDAHLATQGAQPVDVEHQANVLELSPWLFQK
jgi:glyoxylase-like metal-dependent hydrolase (beta-lactamase superfamily II)